MEGFEGQILTSGTQSTNLALRLAPLLSRDDQKTKMIRTGEIDKELYNRRRENIENSKKMLTPHEKLYWNPFKTEDVMAAVTPLPGEIVWHWHHPLNAPWLLRKDTPFDPEDSLTYKTVSEAIHHINDRNFFFVNFNGLSIPDFVKEFDKTILSTENDVYTFDTSDDLLNAIHVKGMLTDQGELVKPEDLMNADNLKMTRPITERYHFSVVNTANSGPSYENEEEKSKMVLGSLQKFAMHDPIKYYIPPFNNRVSGQEMLEKFCINQEEIDQKKKEYSYKFKEQYMTGWDLTKPEEYRKDGRYGLLWNKYDFTEEYLENQLATRKHAILLILLTIRYIDMVTYGKILTFILGNKKLQLFYEIYPGEDKKNQNILLLKEIIQQKNLDKINVLEENEDILEFLNQLHAEITIESKSMTCLSEKRKFAKIFKGSVRKNKRVELFLNMNEI